MAVGTKVGQIYFDLDANTDKFKKNLQDADNRANKLGSNLKAYFDSSVQASQAFAKSLVAVGAAVVGFGALSVKAYNASVEAQTKLSTNLLAVKGNTEANVVSLSKLASKLQSVGVIEDDVIKAGMSQLATFNLQGKTIETLTPKITDMVAQLKGHNATAEDMVGINNLIGKVMTGNIGALGRYGVTLSESQKEQMKSADETKRAAILVEVLSQNYGKVNEALRKTPQGQITAFKNTFGDLMELIGKNIYEVINPFVEGMNAWFESMGGVEGVMAKLTDTWRTLEPYLPMITGAIVGGLTPAFIALALAIGKTTLTLAPWMILGAILFDTWNSNKNLFWAIVAGLTAIGVTIMVIMLPAILTAVGAFISMAAPMAMVIAVGLAVGALAYVILNNWEALKNWMSSFWGFLKNLFGSMIDVMLTPFKTAWEGVKKIWGGLGKLFSGDIFGGLKNVFGGLFNILVAPFKVAFNAIIDLFNNTLGKLNIKIPDWVPGLGGQSWGIPKIPKLALGTDFFKGGLALVGEKGPELVHLPRGSAVTPNDEISSITINVKNEIGMLAGSELAMENLSEMILRKANRALSAKGQGIL